MTVEEVVPAAGWRRTPPALFPICLGSMGLGLALRRGGDAGLIPAWVGEGMLLLAALVVLTALSAYLAKVIARPRVVWEDLAQPPARAALPAGVMAFGLLAGALAPYAPGLGRGILVISLILHLGLIGLVALELARPAALGRVVSPFLFLPFVGLIAMPISAVPLGWSGLATVLMLLTMPPFAVIFMGSLIRAIRHPTPAPLRPILAILLAPVALFLTATLLLGWANLASFFLCFVLTVAAALLARARWLTAAGWTPAWGSFTFPLAAFAGALLLASERFGALAPLAAAVLLAATIIIPTLAVRALLAWRDGSLARTTAAAAA
ncbi:MAG: tellurium resistance protein [Pseudomonadota bacterium]